MRTDDEKMGRYVGRWIDNGERGREGEREKICVVCGLQWIHMTDYSRNTMLVIPPARHILKESSKLA